MHHQHITWKRPFVDKVFVLMRQRLLIPSADPGCFTVVTFLFATLLFQRFPMKTVMKNSFIFQYLRLKTFPAGFAAAGAVRTQSDLGTSKIEPSSLVPTSKRTLEWVAILPPGLKAKKVVRLQRPPWTARPLGLHLWIFRVRLMEWCSLTSSKVSSTKYQISSFASCGIWTKFSQVLAVFDPARMIFPLSSNMSSYFCLTPHQITCIVHISPTFCLHNLYEYIQNNVSFPCNFLLFFWVSLRNHSLLVSSLAVLILSSEQLWEPLHFSNDHQSPRWFRIF